MFDDITQRSVRMGKRCCVLVYLVTCLCLNFLLVFTPHLVWQLNKENLFFKFSVF